MELPPPSRPRGHPDALRRRAPATASAGVREPIGGSAFARAGPRKPRPPRTCTCYGRPSRPARGRRAPGRHRGRCSCPRPLPPAAALTCPTSRAAARFQGCSQSGTERFPKQREAEDGEPTPLHSAAAGALRSEPPREAQDCACAGSGGREPGADSPRVAGGAGAGGGARVGPVRAGGRSLGPEADALSRPLALGGAHRSLPSAGPSCPRRRFPWESERTRAERCFPGRYRRPRVTVDGVGLSRSRKMILVS